MLRGAVENDFLRPSAASELLKGYDEASSDTVNWEEFKIEISEYERNAQMKIF